MINQSASSYPKQMPSRSPLPSPFGKMKSPSLQLYSTKYVPFSGRGGGWGWGAVQCGAGMTERSGCEYFMNTARLGMCEGAGTREGARTSASIPQTRRL